MKQSKAYPTDLTKSQKKYIQKRLPEIFKRRLKNCVFRILEAILYLVKSGCQWNMLPNDFPHWRCVYNHYRSWSDRGWFDKLLKCIVGVKRKSLRRSEQPTTAVIDSQSVKWGTIDSVKGIDGFKRIKGIKRHIAVDSCGYPLAVYISEANTHDSRAAYPLCSKLLADYNNISLIKADNGYCGELEKILGSMFSVKLSCVKSNFGTSEFRPIEGRWVEESYSAPTPFWQILPISPVTTIDVAPSEIDRISSKPRSARRSQNRARGNHEVLAAPKIELAATTKCSPLQK